MCNHKKKTSAGAPTPTEDTKKNQDPSSHDSTVLAHLTEPRKSNGVVWKLYDGKELDRSTTWSLKVSDEELRHCVATGTPLHVCPDCIEGHNDAARRRKEKERNERYQTIRRGLIGGIGEATVNGDQELVDDLVKELNNLERVHGRDQSEEQA